MFQLLRTLKRRLYRGSFLPSPLAVVLNPFFIIRRGIYDAVARFAPSFQGDILDFGCGSKPYESLFSNCSRYVGVDLQVSGHDHRSSKVDVFYDGDRLPFSEDHFDGVVSFEVFEHVFNADEVLQEIHRVLKDDGSLLLTIPFAWDEHEAPFDFARYTSFGIRHLLERNGFSVCDIVKTTTYVLAIFQISIAYLYQHVLPRGRLSRKATQVVVVFPLTVVALLANAILPKKYEYFCNSVVVARKVARSSSDAGNLG